jgi:hypothetical protein
MSNLDPFALADIIPTCLLRFCRDPEKSREEREQRRLAFGDPAGRQQEV